MLINRENLKLLGEDYKAHQKIFEEFMDKIGHLFIDVPSLYIEFLPNEIQLKYLGKLFSLRHKYSIEEKAGYLTVYYVDHIDNCEIFEAVEKYQFKKQGNVRLANSGDAGYPWNMRSFTEDFFYQLIDNLIEFTVEKERASFSKMWQKL